MYNPVFGLINWFLALFGVGNVDWVSQFPMLSIVMVLTWQWTPFMMLIILAGREPVAEILEAARVDGASGWGFSVGSHCRICASSRALRDARRHLPRRDVRRDLHDHPGRARPGHHELPISSISRHFASRSARPQPLRDRCRRVQSSSRPSRCAWSRACSQRRPAEMATVATTTPEQVAVRRRPPKRRGPFRPWMFLLGWAAAVVCSSRSSGCS